MVELNECFGEGQLLSFFLQFFSGNAMDMLIKMLIVWTGSKFGYRAFVRRFRMSPVPISLSGSAYDVGLRSTHES